MRLILVSALLFLNSCGADTFPKYVELGGLRILAIRAENGSAASFSPGDTVTLKPYVSDYKGGTRVITYQAVGCTDPGVSYGAEPACGAGAQTLASGTLTFQAGGVERTGQGDAFTATIPATVLTGRKPMDQYNGVSYLVVYTLTADSTTTSSFKRLVVTNQTTKNQNPTLNGILANGAPLTTWSAGDTQLSADIAAGSAEAFSGMKSDGSLEARTESLLTTYFITDGTLKFYRTVSGETTTYTTEGARPADHTPAVIAVLRDDRGGVSVKVQAL